MTLDLTKIAPQIGDMVNKMKSGNREFLEHLKFARDKLSDESLDLEALRRKIADASTPDWSPAGLVDRLNGRYSAPPAPAEYTVVATDGSNIDIDRHRAAMCYLINIGMVRLHYGSNADAYLDSSPRLYSEEKDLVIRSEDNIRQEQQVRGALLDAKRAVEECRKLAEMVAGLTDETPALALLDGSLVLFGMQNYPDFVVRELVDRGLIQALDEIRRVSNDRPLAMASYISFPQSDDVVNTLRIAICPQEVVDCDRFCAGGESACDVISGVSDRVLFSDLLAPGERSSVFLKPSAILKRYGEHQVYFFYLRSEEEIARVEIPEWVVRRPDLLELTHALVLDQCRRGHGYPVALSEAHEKAVVTRTEREEFWLLVEQAMEEEKLPARTSIKNRSKLTRWI